MEAGTQLDETWSGLVLSERFDHRCQLPGKTPPLSTQLPANVATESVVLDRALERHRQVGGIAELTPYGAHLLLDRPLEGEQRRLVLERLAHAGHPRLLEHVLADLDERGLPTFGHTRIHTLLTLDQYNELAKRRPELLQDSTYVKQVMARLEVSGQDLDEDERLGQIVSFAEQILPTFSLLAYFGHRDHLFRSIVITRFGAS